MAVKIRLSRGGRKKSPFYHIIIADARAPRDGKFIERIGTYNPMTKPASIELDRDKAFEWLMKGAQPTDTVRAMLRFKGVLYRKHLARGVAKGALDQDAADKMYQEWIDAKEAKIADRRAETERLKEEERKKIFGSPKKKAIVASAPATEALEEFKATEVDAPVEAAKEEPKAEEPQAEEPAKEETAPTEEPKAEEPAKEEAAPAEEPKSEEPAKDEAAPAEEVKVEEPAKEETAPAEETKAEEPAKEEAAPAEEAKAVVEEVKVEAAAAPVAAAAVAATAVSADPDDLTKIEGIGPAIAKVLNGASITTFAELAANDADKIKAILEGAEGNFSMHDPTTWPKQAQMASDGDWDGLKKWQDELDGGKEVATSSEEE